MRIAQKNVIDSLSLLDPATDARVDKLTLVLGNAMEFVTNHVTVERGMIYARSIADADHWLYLPIEEVIGVTAHLNRAACIAAKIDTLAELLADAAKR